LSRSFAVDVFVLNGQYDIEKGGSITVTNSNGTFADSSVALTLQFKTEPQSSEWESNTTMTITKKSGGKASTITGRILFLNQGSTVRPYDIIWYTADSVPSHPTEACIWISGPNPPPRPPGPGPGPSPSHSNCVEVFNETACAAAPKKACSWCTSTNGAHGLCYSSETVSKLDTKKWKCGQSSTGAAAIGSTAVHAVDMSRVTANQRRRLAKQPVPNPSQCTNQYKAQTYNTSQADMSSTVADWDACCTACSKKTDCKFWGFNPNPMNGDNCFMYKPLGYHYPMVYHAADAAIVGIHNTPSPGPGPGPHPPMPTPAPVKPTPPPTPPPAPTPPTPGPSGAKNWAVIVAGSTGYGNYRHQTDACHAYNIVIKNGIPKERVILMMQDDVANSPENPYPGQLFNQPTADGTPGFDVYENCFPDYTGPVVTGQLFLDVLTGNKTDPTRTKVLESSSIDKVFVNFADHGGGKIIEMPHGGFLHAEDLVGALKEMNSKKMYEKLVFYMEACNSGSMFQDLLPTDINIYATTASNPTEPSWGTYCPPMDKVNGKEIKSCLGDLYSVNWMEDSDTASGEAERLGDQFIKVRGETNKSHPMEYGTQDFKWSDHDSDYQGEKGGNTTVKTSTPSPAGTAPKDLVDSRDIELLLSFYDYLRAEEGDEHRSTAAAKLIAQVEAREHADRLFDAIFTRVRTVSNKRDTLLTATSPHTVAQSEFSSQPVELTQCEKSVLATAERKCLHFTNSKFSSYSLKYTKELIDLCAEYTVDSIEAGLNHVC
jgi:legumain